MGYDTQVFRRQIVMESGWNPKAVSRARAEGIAQIIPRWHPSMRGRTFDPFASLEYAANLMASHIDYRGGDYREALADYNTGRASRGKFRDEGYRYANWILEGLDMATSLELDDLRADRDRKSQPQDGGAASRRRTGAGGPPRRRTGLQAAGLAGGDDGGAVLSRSGGGGVNVGGLGDWSTWGGLSGHGGMVWLVRRLQADVLDVGAA